MIELSARRAMGTGLVVLCGRPGEHQARPTGPAVRDPAVFHDHEGFTTLWSIKLFAIMKIRSGIRIASADMGGFGPVCGIGRVARPGPGTRQPGGPGNLGFRRPPPCVLKRQGRFPNRRAFRRALGGIRPKPEERATRLASPSAICDGAGYLCYLGATCPFAHRAYRACIFIACTPHRPVTTGAQSRSP